mmetsp:Transcript_12688/g.26175  ORF Transcript_12688/g.26175 Transcript_12688/m.26175 type:complete len:371 (-) Transcript_12688:126-1238(-)
MPPHLRASGRVGIGPGVVVQVGHIVRPHTLHSDALLLLLSISLEPQPHCHLFVQLLIPMLLLLPAVTLLVLRCNRCVHGLLDTRSLVVLPSFLLRSVGQSFVHCSLHARSLVLLDAILLQRLLLQHSLLLLHALCRQRRRGLVICVDVMGRDRAEVVGKIAEGFVGVVIVRRHWLMGVRALLMEGVHSMRWDLVEIVAEILEGLLGPFFLLHGAVGRNQHLRLMESIDLTGRNAVIVGHQVLHCVGGRNSMEVGVQLRALAVEVLLQRLPGLGSLKLLPVPLGLRLVIGVDIIRGDLVEVIVQLLLGVPRCDRRSCFLLPLPHLMVSIDSIHRNRLKVRVQVLPRFASLDPMVGRACAVFVPRLRHLLLE